MRNLARVGVLMIAVVTALIGCGAPVDEKAGRIAFQTAANSPSEIMIMNGDGTAPHLVISDGSDPTLRSDGRLVAFIMQSDIYTIRATGTGLFKVTDYGLGVDIRDAVITKAGDRIAYVREVVNPVPAEEMRIINSDGTGDSLLLTDGEQPAWNQDGTQIAFVRGPDIWTVNTDGTGLTNVTNNGFGVRSSEPAFSPTSIQIAYSESPVVPSAISSIRVVDIVQNEKTTVIANGSQPTYRPDGARIAFVRTGDIYSVKTTGADLQQLTSGTPNDEHPSWANLPE